MAKKDIATATDSELMVRALREGSASFTSMTDEFVDFIEGSGDLIEDKQILERVPFGIVGGTFWVGKKGMRTLKFKDGFEKQVQGDFVTLKIIIADEATLEKMGATLPTGLMALGEYLINDGSTGFRRQTVRHLVRSGYVKVLPTDNLDEYRETGGLGSSDYDWPVHLWDSFEQGEVSFSGSGEKRYSFTLDRLLIARRGLRASTYTNDYGDGETWYLA